MQTGCEQIINLPNWWQVVIIFLAAVIIMLYLWLERAFPPRRSTHAFFNLSSLPIYKRIEGYFYASRPQLYLRPATWKWVTGSGHSESADGYHGKVLIGDDASKLVSLKHPVELRDLDHVIPYPLARDIVLSQPDSLVAMQCPCRAQKKDACQPLDVCLVVGEPFASFAVEHQPGRARFISLEECLEILKEEEERGHIHTAWFKDAMHHRFYAICNCCSCCCLGIKSFQRGAPRLTHSGYLPVINQDECTACGNCNDVCHFHAIATDENLTKIDLDLCMGCGLCVSHCPTGALALTLAPHKGIPLDIERLMQEKGQQTCPEVY